VNRGRRHSVPGKNAGFLEKLLHRVYMASKPVTARIVGTPYFVELESANREENIDHVWFTLQAPPHGSVLLSVNFLSKLNRDAGFDFRVRLAVQASDYVERPEPVIQPDCILDYRDFEKEAPLDFAPMDPFELATLLINKGREALRIEAWGELYRRDTLGLHQIHSQRSSCAVEYDILGRDGAIKFYLPDGTAELFLLKYCGQA